MKKAYTSAKTITGIVLILCGFVCLFSPTSSSAITLIADIDADTYINEHTPDATHNTDLTIEAGEIAAGGAGYDDVHRSLIRGDLSTIPVDFDIGKATLYLYFDGHSTWGQDQEVNVHRSLKAWDDNATWNNYSTGNGWTTAGMSAGTDYTASATATKNTPAAATGWVAFDVTQDVKAFYAGTANNYGWAVFNSDEATQTDYVRFRSTDYNIESLRPYLQISEAVPEPESLAFFVIGGLLAILRRYARKKRMAHPTT